MILIDSNHHDDDYNDDFYSYYPMRVPITVDRNHAVDAGACCYVASSFLPVDFVYDHRYQNYHVWATAVPTAFDLVADVVDVDAGQYYHHEEEDDVTVVLVVTCSLISPLLPALY